jgi:hypothetical protein
VHQVNRCLHFVHILTTSALRPATSGRHDRKGMGGWSEAERAQPGRGGGGG